MITAIDSNVLLDILIPDESFYEASARAIQDCSGDGSLVVSEIVYAELCVNFETRHECDGFLAAIDIRVQAATRDTYFLASRIWRGYRRQGGKRSQILADFMIGAQAQNQSSRLLSRDRGFYRKLFPELALLDPARP